ncbi:MAG: NAD(+)/NADH kinase [Thermodesulfobacteriota bacterium]
MQTNTGAPRAVYIVAKAGHAAALALSGEISAWLAGRGVDSKVMENSPQAAGLLPDRAGPGDLLLVLGGDGTMLGVSREAVPRGLPVLGLNLGRVGFLNEVPVQDWPDCLAGILERGFTTSGHTVLRYAVERGGAVARSGLAVNDLVVSRGSLARLIHLGLAVDGEPLTGMRADGVIVATPLGSTAYSVSAGGPIVHPSLDAFTVTPICPFLQNVRPLALPGRSELAITVEEQTPKVHLTVDGQEGLVLEPGDVLKATRSGQDLLLVSLGRSTYLARLRAKGIV